MKSCSEDWALKPEVFGTECWKAAAQAQARKRWSPGKVKTTKFR